MDCVKEAFPEVEIVNLKELPDEFAFITSTMRQGEYEERIRALADHIVTMIRVKD